MYLPNTRIIDAVSQPQSSEQSQVWHDLEAVEAALGLALDVIQAIDNGEPVTQWDTIAALQSVKYALHRSLDSIRDALEE